MGHQAKPKRKFTEIGTAGDRYARGTPLYKETFNHLKFWFNGKLVTKTEHDNLSWEEIFIFNNVIRK